MRILTVRQPWAWAIIHGGKDVENRPRNIAGGYRGPVAMHAGKAFADDAWDHPVLGPMLEDALRRGDEIEFTPGAIIGVVELVGVHNAHRGPEWERALPKCSPWAEQGAYHLELANARPLAEPIPCTGALGLRKLDNATVAQIERQLS